MGVQTSVPLAPRTTLRLGGAAARYVEATTDEGVAVAVKDAAERGDALFVLGGGSNVVVADAGFDGTVLHMATKGVTVVGEGDGRATVDVAAGEPWDPFVARAVAEGWSGVEALSGIPGLVGATPVQNVGAYGVEVSDVLEAVRVLDRDEGSVAWWPAPACGLRYRHSRFKGSAQYIILAARFALPTTPLGAPVRYAELARALGAKEGARVPAAAVRDAVLSLRRAKGMVLDEGDAESMSAGSFFTNPVVPSDEADAVERRARDAGLLGPAEAMPRFAAEGGRVKLAAGWLVERAGFFKGYGAGAVGVSRKHALALVHRGGGTTAELLALARAIRDGVRGRFGVTLVPEPVMVGATW